METGVRPGRVLLLSDVTPALVNTTMRVTGVVQRVDAGPQRVIIEHDGASLVVDKSGVSHVQFVRGLAVQFIGDLAQDWEPGSLVLRARLCRVVDGIDMDLYATALRRFEPLMRSSALAVARSSTSAAAASSSSSSAAAAAAAAGAAAAAAASVSASSAAAGD